MGRYNAAARDFPDGGDKYGIMASAIPSVLLVKQQSIEVAEEKGFEVAYSYDYQSQGETGWANFVREMKDKDIKILEFIGQPQNLIELTDEMAIADWHPEVILLSTNFYDDLYRQGATTDSNLYIQSAFYPLEMADENKATQDYLDLMEQYNPDGKVAQLGMQGLSSWLLFAKAATACGSELTAECLLDGGGRRRRTGPAAGSTPRQTPGSSEPSPCFLHPRAGRRRLLLQRGGHRSDRRRLQLRRGERVRDDRRLQRVRRSAEGGLTAPRVRRHGGLPQQHRSRAVHRRGLRAGGERARPHLHHHRHLQLRPRRDRDARRLLLLAAARRLGLADPARARHGRPRHRTGARRADRARDHARPRRRARDDPDHHHGQPARRDPRGRPSGSGPRRRCTGCRCCSPSSD